MATLELKNISKTFGRGTPNEAKALDNVSLKINDEDFLVVIGSNGSGKTTLLNVIAGDVQTDDGDIFLGDAYGMTSINRMKNFQRARFIGRIFQNPFSGTSPSMTVAENLQLAFTRTENKSLSIGLNGKQKKFFRENLSVLGMNLENKLNSPMGLLSGGQRQAITLLMATLNLPKIFLLDEHTASLDPKSSEQILELTEKIISENKITSVMVTHDMDEAVRFGNHLVMMHQGKIVWEILGEEKKKLKVLDLHLKFDEMKKETER